MINALVVSLSIFFISTLYASEPSPLNFLFNPQLSHLPSLQSQIMIQESAALKSTVTLLGMLAGGGAAGVYVARGKIGKELGNKQVLASLAKLAKKVKKGAPVTLESMDEEDQGGINYFLYEDFAGDSVEENIENKLKPYSKSRYLTAIQRDGRLFFGDKKEQVNLILSNNKLTLPKESNGLKTAQGNTHKECNEPPSRESKAIQKLSQEVESIKHSLVNSEKNKEAICIKLAEADSINKKVKSEISEQESHCIYPLYFETQSDEYCHISDHKHIGKLKKGLANAQSIKKRLERELNQVYQEQVSLKKRLRDKEDKFDQLVGAKAIEVATLKEQIHSYTEAFEREKEQAAENINALNCQVIGLHSKHDSCKQMLCFKEKELDKQRDKQREGFVTVLTEVAEQMAALKSQNEEIIDRNDKYLSVDKKRYQEEIEQLQESFQTANAFLTQKDNEILRVSEEKDRVAKKLECYLPSITNKEREIKKLEVQIEMLQGEIDDIALANKGYKEKEKKFINSLEKLKAENNNLDKGNFYLQKELGEVKRKFSESEDDARVICQELEGLIENYKTRINNLQNQVRKNINPQSEELNSCEITPDEFNVREAEKDKIITNLLKMNQLTSERIDYAIKKTIDETLNWWDDVDAGKKDLEQECVTLKNTGKGINEKPFDRNGSVGTLERIKVQENKNLADLKKSFELLNNELGSDGDNLARLEEEMCKKDLMYKKISTLKEKNEDLESENENLHKLLYGKEKGR